MPRPDSPEMYTHATCGQCDARHSESDEQNTIDWAKEHAADNPGHELRLNQEVH